MPYQPVENYGIHWQHAYRCLGGYEWFDRLVLLSPGLRSPAVRSLYGTGEPLPEDFKQFLVLGMVANLSIGVDKRSARVRRVFAR
jgi:hypothetical protein